MKKKGLIISTIVMVVVLIAALTTSTYAWFSQSANAAIESIDVVTAASEGLQIAVYDSSSGDFTSGSTSLSNGAWVGANGGWGESLTFDLTGGGVPENAVKFYAVSGDGQTMYSPVTPNDAVNENKITAESAMKTAVANGEYFIANVALTNTKSAADEVVISDIGITPVVGGAAQTSGIVNAMRIAVFTKSAYNGAATLQFVLNPYSNVKYSAASRQFTRETDNTQTAYLTHGADPAFVSGTSAYSTFTKTATFAAAKYIAGAKAEAANVVAATGATGTIHYTKTDQASLFNFGSVASNGVVYLQIVIWFEGEDVDCINAFAGGGASVSMNFGFVGD